MTRRSKVQLKESLEGFILDLNCDHDCATCKYAVYLNSEVGYDCPVYIVLEMIAKWVKDGKI